MLFSRKQKRGIVNVKMIITEEKILSNIDKVQKLINPDSKKQIVQLEEDAFFKDLIDSIKIYLIEYPNKKNFPSSVYNQAHALVEYATNQFEENTKQIEVLIRQRENNINVASQLKNVFEAVKKKSKDWKTKVKSINGVVSEDIIEALTIVGKTKTKKPVNYEDCLKLINARINNLEANTHIEIDMERIEDRSKALSYIGIEIAEALGGIPKPASETKKAKGRTKAKVQEATAQETKVAKVEGSNVQNKKVVKSQIIKEEKEEETVVEEKEEETFEVKPSLWQRFKQSRFVQNLKRLTQIRIVFDVPALPEGRGESK